MTTANNDDVNLAFESLFMAEDSRYKEGLADGATLARNKSFNDGRQLGITKGSELAQEVGFYEGFVESLANCLDDKKKVELSETSSGRRAMTVVAALGKLLKDFALGTSTIDPSQSKLTDDLDKIRGKFQQAMSLLKMNVSFNMPDSSSF